MATPGGPDRAPRTLLPEQLAPLKSLLAQANLAFDRAHPLVATPDGAARRQPIHTVYGGAQLFTAGTVTKLGRVALKALEDHAPTGAALARALGETPSPAWDQVHARVVGKLKREPIEDYRIDFEDGYGHRSDAEEDGHAQTAASELARALAERTLPPGVGIRIKALGAETFERATRTLDVFLTTMLQRTGGTLPPGFVVTLPKVTHAEQCHALAQCLRLIEARVGLPLRALKLELMVETPQAILDAKGSCPLREFVTASDGRCVALHFGAYDYTAALDVTAGDQRLGNPACDHARHVMQLAMAGTGIPVVDGATTTMPVGTPDEVHAAWRRSRADIRHALETGYVQGWDLHPAQLPIRYATVYAFFADSLEPVSARLRAFVDKAAKATLLGNVFDDAASGQGLLNFFLRGIACGALSEEEATRTGLSVAELRTRSFAKIVVGRAKG